MNTTLKKALRTAQINFPAIQDTRFTFQRVLRTALKVPHEKDFSALKIICSNCNIKLALDIGANRGESIASMSIFAKKSKIISFEPNVIIYNKLKRDFKNWKNVSIVNSGLGDKEEELELFIPFYKNYMFDGLASFIRENASLSLNTRIFNYKEKFVSVKKVSCYIKKLDSFGHNPDFIKMDVQGYELNVIKGGLETIKKNKPLLLIESPENAITDLLSDHDYIPLAFENGNLRKGYGKLNTFYISTSSKHYDKLKAFIKD